MNGSRRDGAAAPPSAPSQAPSQPTPTNQSHLAQPPADLSEKRRAFWALYAPAAIAEGTLTDSQVAGFRELSAHFVIAQDLFEQTENYRLVYQKYLDYIKTSDPAALGPLQLQQLLKQVETFGESYENSIKLYLKACARSDSSLARFKLTGMGKPEPVKSKPKPASSQWGAFGPPPAASK